jgi:hypothetical protein
MAAVMHHLYAVQLWPTTFGEWALVAEGGRIGSPGKVTGRLSKWRNWPRRR